MKYDDQSYEDLVFRLRQDLQTDLATDVLPYSRAVQPAWRSLTLLNGWDGFVNFYVDTSRRLWLNGLLSTVGTSDTVAFSLPTGYRPGAEAGILRPLVDGTLTWQVAIAVGSTGDAVILYTGLGTPTNVHVAASYRVEQ